MAKVKLLSVLNGLTGKISKDDNVTFRNSYGETIIYKHGVSTAEPTPSQLTAREKFKKAVEDAREALLDPIQKALFLKSVDGRRNKTVFGVAFKHFYANPTL